MATTVRYDIVDHCGDSAVSINGVVYDNAEKFVKDFPKDQYGTCRFECEIGFSWQEMVDDMLEQWA